MTSYYTCFRAGGRALEAVERLETLRAQWEPAACDLRQRTQAEKLTFFDYPRRGRVDFWYAAGRQPKGWDVIYRATADGVITGAPNAPYVVTRPPEGGDLDQWIRQTLWEVFGSFNPMRPDALGKMLGAPDMPPRLVRDEKGSENLVPDPIWHEQAALGWRICVPCDQKGAPRFTPPDSPVVFRVSRA